MCEFEYLPNQHLDRAPAVTWAETRDFGRNFFARGKIEAVVHGHMTADAAVVAARGFAAAIKAQPATETDLLRRDHLALAAGSMVVDAQKIAGANSAIWELYLLPEETPQLRAAAAVLGKFISEPFYTELRTRQQLGYIVGSGASSSLRQYLQMFVIQSSAYSPDELRQRADTYLATLPE
ncbi:MAG: insulinase family protein [Cephaloticoccus sp.]|nr:insulinase family protein [Cephaloticoccus sp.]MCF7760071.1 insulinase family protein [Cephaloticoccus sp.]